MDIVNNRKVVKAYRKMSLLCNKKHLAIVLDVYFAFKKCGTIGSLFKHYILKSKI